VAGDAFILLINIFNNSTIDLVTEKFIQQLVTAIDHITDEDTQNALVGILIMMCAAYEKKI
jgi:hypothetical protein